MGGGDGEFARKAGGFLREHELLTVLTVFEVADNNILWSDPGDDVGMQEDWEQELKVKRAGGVPLCLDGSRRQRCRSSSVTTSALVGYYLYRAAIRKTMYRVLDAIWGLESFKQ